MKRLIRIKRPLAAIMLLVFTCQLLTPLAARALTSGPAQPEMKGFEPAGTANLVDPFSGDFTYNIPLMDVGGYPLNIAYHSGSGMDDEASWVGFGWSLNPGAIDRQMRGLPDDFNGAAANGDKIVKEFNMRNDITGGVNFEFKPEFFGFGISSIAKLGLQAGIFYNNKRGLGIEFGMDANAPLLSTNKSTAGPNTAGLSASASLNFNSQNGASFNPTLNFSIVGKSNTESEKSAGLGIGGGMNARSGLQYTTLSAAYNPGKNEGDRRNIVNMNNASYTSYAAQPFVPETQAEYFSQSYSLAPQLGGEIWGTYPAVQLSGHYSIQKVAHPVTTYNAYGFMHGNDGKNDGKALMDFNREKDVPYFDGVPNLPVPVATPDLFMANAQDGSGQYRAYLGGTGIFSDHDAVNTSVSASLGVEIGFGAGFKTGGDVQGSLSKSTTTKWETGDKFLYQDKNIYDAFGNFTGAGDVNDLTYEPVYFKRVGESVPVDGSIYDKVKGNIPVRIKTQGTRDGATAMAVFSGKDNTETAVTKNIVRDKREARNNSFSYLTNAQTRIAGLDKKVFDYYLSAGGFTPLLNRCSNPMVEAQQQPYKKDHHIGEITITDEGGTRKIYGIPAYNTYQEDVSFSIPQNTNADDKARGLVAYTPRDASGSNNNGLDHFYSKEIIPGYAHSFLLSGILSPDYTDITGDGITDDDLGTAVKFNYWRKTDKFQWRTPYTFKGNSPGDKARANYNEGLQSDRMDDRGNYSYGTKELWYLHSIESKTMVAVFETGNREDALGADAAGTKDLSVQHRQQYLKTIKLYSKADWYKNTANAIPIKTVHFVYNYSLFSNPGDIHQGVPNNSGDALAAPNENIASNEGGKLTLKKIFFTYQDNTKGVLQPYEFTYDFNKTYEWKQFDRWGNYKNAASANPTGVSNDFYPYSTQDKMQADANATLWQLTKIATPAGGIISVQYESDDYSYVQQKKAMQMYPMAGIGYEINKNSGYYQGDKIFVQLPQALGSDAELRARYFDGGSSNDSKHLFFKAWVKLRKNEEKYDYVAGYAEIENIQTDVKLAAGTNNVAEIKVRKIKGEGVSKEYHPIAKAAWQFMRLNTPSLVYPGYNVREDAAPMQFVKALLGAISSISELLAPFDTRAEIKKLAPEIDLSRSWVRLDAATSDTKKINGNPYYAKLGGGLRVKEVSMSDEWNSMSQSAAQTASYGMVYDYSTRIKLSNGEEVTASSGVASYEPMIGSEENPFHQPSKYQQKVKLGPDNAFFIDEPLCESYFPGASVGYSRVTVRNKGADGQVGATGYTVNEFYTAKDYPTVVSHTPIDVQRFGGANILQMLAIKKNNSRVASQGYTIELNDMQGKPASEKIVDRGGNEISSVYYYYRTVNQDAPEKKLNNEALVLQKDGSISNAVIGRDIEMYSDMRSQTSFTAGVNVMINVDAIYLLFAVIPIPNILPLPNAAYTGFRSASTIKIIQQYGILDKVVKRQNGSRITTENLAWDANTGEVLLTRSQNEFDDPVYGLSYPSHWAYDDGMGPAYKNLGLMIANFSATGGLIASAAATQLLVPGDELLIKNNSGVYQKYWINKAGVAGASQLVLIDGAGIPATVSSVTALIVRSGRRNMQTMAIGSLVSLVNPVKNGRLNIGAFTKILDANGSIYNDEWAIEAKNVLNTVMVCPDGYLTDATGRCYKEIPVGGTPVFPAAAAIYPQQSTSYSVCGTRLVNNSVYYAAIGGGEPPANQITSISTAAFMNGSTACSGANATTFNGPLNRCGIWTQGVTAYRNEWIGTKTKLTIKTSDLKNSVITGNTARIFIGFAAQHNIEIRIDNVLVAAYGDNSSNGNTNTYRYWRIKPVSITLDTQHEIYIRTLNKSTTKGVMGVELYDNTVAQLRNAICAKNNCAGCTITSPVLSSNPLCNNNTVPARILWSTDCLSELNYFNYHATASGTAIPDFNLSCSNGALPFEDAQCNPACPLAIQRIYTAKIPRTICALPVGKTINPYTTGMRGNWRMQQSFAYHTDRESLLPEIKPGDPDVIEKTDIRKSGAYAVFNPFWNYQAGTWLAQPQLQQKDVNWVKGNEITFFNQKGQEIENVDALHRYSAAQFGYGQSLATAVASNARYTDIGYDGFEDYDFDVDDCLLSDTCNLDGHFSTRRLSRKYPSAVSTDAGYAHTGRNSLRVTAGADASIVLPLLPAGSNVMYTFLGAYMQLTDKGILYGLKPQPGKAYLLSAWIKDEPVNNPVAGADESSNVQLLPGESGKAAVEIIAGGATIASTLKAGPRVEQWRKVEVVFSVPVNGSTLQIKFRPGSSTAWFDDIRIQPYEAQMKTFAYDNRSMRLWAELDENNFATFYEYDDEGILIRVKKETERGIMTIKETRSTYRTGK